MRRRQRGERGPERSGLEGKRSRRHENGPGARGFAMAGSEKRHDTEVRGGSRFRMEPFVQAGGNAKKRGGHESKSEQGRKAKSV